MKFSSTFSFQQELHRLGLCWEAFHTPNEPAHHALRRVQFWLVQWPNLTNIKWWLEADNSGAIEASATFTVGINYTMMEGGQLYINSFGYKEKFTCQYCYKSTHLCTTARVHQSSTHRFSTLQGTDPALMSCCKIYAVALLGHSKLQARLGWLLV